MMTEAGRWRKNILLVDDEEIIRRTLSRDIEEIGYGVTAVADGETALAGLRERYYDLVLTDLRMEGISGIEVLKEVKARSPEIGVIILTGFGDISSAIEALRNGADDYLLKPYAYEELATRLQNCLEKLELKKRLKVYEDILPICSVCKKIRNDKGQEPGYCPDCYEKFMQDMETFSPARKE